MKRGLAKLEETESAWETLAPNETFYGLTLAEFKAKVKTARDDDALILNLEQQLATARNRKADNLEDALAVEKNVVRAIGGDPKHGQNSDLWEATGRVRTSERKTGLTRKKNADGK